MDYKEIINKIKKHECRIHKFSYNLDIEKSLEFIPKQFSIRVQEGIPFNVDVGDYEVRLWPTVRTIDKLNRYEIILEIFIYIRFEEDFSETINKWLFEGKANNLIFELLKLSIPTIQEAIKKSFIWMGFKDYGTATQEELMEVFERMTMEIEATKKHH